MKILNTTWNIFRYENDSLIVSRGGLPIIVEKICDYIGRREECYLFLGAMAVGNMDYGNFHIIDNTKNLPNERNSENICEWQDALQMTFKEVIKELVPDFVLIQGNGEFSERCIQTCIDLKQKYAYVHHSYFGKGDQGYDKEGWEKWEQRLFSIPDLKVIMVGNGMRKRFLKDYPDFLPDNVVSITNGTHFNGEKEYTDLAEKYPLSGRKILICVGRIYKRKNQCQLVKAFSLLSEDIKNSICVLFCGTESLREPGIDELVENTRKYHLEDSLFYIGSLDEHGMMGLYTLADGLVMPSISEGLSLVALEAISYGKPLIMFSDNETAEDVNDKNVVVFAKDRSDESLKSAIEEWYGRTWDVDYIKKYSEHFTMERVARDYIDYCYKEIKTRA